ncbi:MAG: serine/threonine protein kinase, partial [Labilithrix sp.]|nr:serine/threonine protein kinase [Labilithrix sp.]
MTVKPGDILRDRLRVDALIGRGGMGQVFAATDLESRAQVAIKVVSRLLVDDVLMARLHREAEAAQRIRSDFVPRVLEVSDTDEGETFLVMERLVGEPLSQRIRDRGALSWSEVRRVGEDILRGLIDAHAAGIVHRDLKPSNVFLALKSSRVRAMVLDFGVCKMDGVDAERLTGTGESIGTVAYMAPEQIRGAARVDERADLFAFGVLVFEMLSGRLPHEGPSQMAILASKLENAPARLKDCSRVAIPEGVDALV